MQLSDLKAELAARGYRPLDDARIAGLLRDALDDLVRRAAERPYDDDAQPRD